MTQLKKYRAEKFRILSVNELSDSVLLPFTRVIHDASKRINKKSFPLGGRAEIVIKNLPETGMVVFKNYFRGGLPGLFNKRYYLRCKTGIRPVKEIEFLLKLKDMDIPVPEPVAAYYCGKHVYRGGIVTSYINSSFTLAEYSIRNKDKAKELFFEKFIPVYEKLIKNSVYHPDLHPGNVLVSNEDEIFIIDFDKAEICDDLSFYLREKLEERWNRAVRKHKLPTFLTMALKKQP